MAGLLDITPEQLMQLLQVSEQDKEAARRQAFIAAGLGMLSGQGRGGAGALQNIGQGGLYGLNAYQQSLAGARQAGRDKLGAYQQALALAQQQEKLREEQRAQQAMLADWQEMQQGQGQPAGAIAPMAAPVTMPPVGYQNPGLPEQIDQGGGVTTTPVPPQGEHPNLNEMLRLQGQAYTGDQHPAYATAAAPQASRQQSRRAAIMKQMETVLRIGGPDAPKRYQELKAQLDTQEKAVSDAGKLLEDQQRYERGSPEWRVLEQVLQRKAEAEMPAEWRLFKQQNPDKTYADFIAQEKELRRSGATNINMPQPGLEKLVELSSERDALTRLASGFKDEFGGFVSEAIGRGKIEIGLRIGDPSGMAQWWQEYQTYANNVRHRLFGSALTETERTQFDRAMIHPGMNPRQVRENLRRQEAAVAAAVEKWRRVYSSGTYNPRQIEAATGPTSPPSQSGAAPASAGEIRVERER